MNSFDDWFHSEPYRKKYEIHSTAYLAAREGYKAGIERAAEVVEHAYFEADDSATLADLAEIIRKEIDTK